MNKRQLCILWVAVCLLASMVWFPGSWFGFIVEGYPALKPDSREFLVKVLLPLAAFTVLLLYSLGDRTVRAAGAVRARARRPRVLALAAAILILAAGLVLGFIAARSMMVQDDPPGKSIAQETQRLNEAGDEFRNFCRREGYRQQVEELTAWLREEHASRVAILYNGDDAYSHDLYTYFSKRLPDEKITIAVSDTFQDGERSFSQELTALESAQPEAIIFLGSYEERLAFMETIAQRPQGDFWQQRIHKIRWFE